MTSRRRRIVTAVITSAIAMSALAGCASGAVVPVQPAPTLVSSKGDAPVATHAWSFDDGSGTTASDSAEKGAASMSLENGAAWTTGTRGTALALNGNGQDAVANVPDFDVRRSYSVSAWVRMSSVGASFQTFVSEDPSDGTSSAFFLQYAGTERAFAFSFGAARAVGARTRPIAGRWYHLVGVRDIETGTLSLFVNGLLAGSIAVPYDATPASGEVAVGRAVSGGGPADFVGGAVDDVRLFSGALSERQVAALFDDEGTRAGAH